MIDIINRWTDAIMRHSETADTIAQAVMEAIKGGANLRDAKQYVIRIQGSRHEINVIDRDVRIGCKRMTLDEWLTEFEAIGEEQGYTPQQIAEYGAHLRHIAALIQMRESSTKEATNAAR